MVSATLALAAAIALWLAAPPAEQLDKALDGVLPVAITVAAVLAGFIATTLSVIVGLSDRPVMALLIRMDARDRLVRYNFGAIVYLVAFAILSSALLVVSSNEGFQAIEAKSSSLSRTVVIVCGTVPLWIGSVAVSKSLRVTMVMRYVVIRAGDDSLEAPPAGSRPDE